MKTVLRYSLVFATMALLSGCKKWLELKPLDGIIRQEFWKTKEQVQAAVTGIYSSMMGGTTTTNVEIERPLPELFFLWGEGRGDMISPTARAISEEIDLTTLNILPTNRITNWRFVYQTINYCNTVIDLAPGVLQTDATFNQQQLDIALSQAYAIRAMLYFYLVRTFDAVPLKLKATISDQDLANLKKSSADTILAQVVADLKKAEAGAPVSYGNVTIDKGRITKAAVQAMLADVYLWMDKYTECVAECDKIINSNRFGLVAGNAAWFERLYYNGNSAEHIFSLQFDAQKLNSFYFMHAT
ncbi:MAG TPA: RagB/SusD family nutrient uptake outer membrane protein, partial [Phnomibacter sp.]|nr:RagB/SusD family nutrient uptake outer membrane protein [Phnomibacter sp.]